MRKLRDNHSQPKAPRKDRAAYWIQAEKKMREKKARNEALSRCQPSERAAA